MVMRRITLENFCKKKAKSFVFRGMMAEVSGRAECELHPLIHTFLKFNLAQDMVVFQRFSGLGKGLLQRGHAFSECLTITVSLHLGHLTGWTFTRLISSGSRLVIGPLRVRRFSLWWFETGS
jgi:hypothetical protein